VRPVTGVGRRGRFGVFWAFLVVLSWLLAASPWRYPLTGDGALVARTGISLAFERSFALPRPPEKDAGDWFYLFQPAGGGPPAAIYAPLGAFLRAGSILASGVLPPGLLRGRVTDISICLWSVLFTAALVWPLSRLFRYGGGGRAAAAPVAAALVLGTALGPLGTSDFQEPFLAFLLAASLERVLFARRLGESLRPRHLVLGGTLTGAALLAKPTAIVVVPALFLAVFFTRGRRRPMRDGALLALGILPFAALTLWLNAVRFGNALEFGYSGQLAHPLARVTPFGWNLLRITVLPNRGLLWFSPILLLAVLGIARLSRRARRADRGAALLAVAALLATNALWWSWEGGMSWGPRLAAPCVALSAPLLWSGLRRFRTVALVLGLAGFVLNLPGYLLEYPRIYWFARAHCGESQPLGPVVPMHLDATRGTIQVDQRVHYSPGCAPEFVGFRVLATLTLEGDGPAAGNPGGVPEDSLLARLAMAHPVFAPSTDIGKMLLGEAVLRSDQMPASALRFARAVRDWGGSPREAEALVRKLESRGSGVATGR
jgi:hypothetical protein